MSSAEPSGWMVRQRSSEITSLQEVISGRQQQFSRSTDGDRRELHKPAIIEISPEASLALRAGALLTNQNNALVTHTHTVTHIIILVYIQCTCDHTGYVGHLYD